MRGDPRAVERYGYVLAAACVAAATALFYHGREHFAKGQWALLYLLIVGLVAGVSGVRPALAAAVLSFFTWNYFFLPPYGTFRIADPRDWLSLFVFLIVGVAIGIQTGRLRNREAQAVARERETALLNRFSAHLVSDISVGEVTRRLVEEVGRITGAGRVALLLEAEAAGGAKSVTSPEEDGPLPAEVAGLAAWVRQHAKAVGLPAPPSTESTEDLEWPATVSHQEAGARAEGKSMLLPLYTSTRQLGVLYVGERKDGTAYTFHEARMAVALAYLASMFLERTQLRSLAVQADALAEADRLKSTLVSAVSHELKTPLASLTATITGLLEGDLPWDEERARQELRAIEQDLVRLGGSIGSLLDLSRLEASEWRPHVEHYEFGEILGTALSKLTPGQRSRVSVSVPVDLPTMRVDFDQWVRVLEHLLGNALIYSGLESPVRVGADVAGAEIRIWVEDEGPGIAPEERERVFDRFYRGKAAAAASGTGIGLAITSEIVRFHGGRIWIEDVMPHGARFVISLPAVEEQR